MMLNKFFTQQRRIEAKYLFWCVFWSALAVCVGAVL